jgi:dTDP-4-dehydrorhamnose reductase
MPLEARHLPILVTGAHGLLGSALGPRLLAAAPDAAAVHLTDVEDLDVTDAEAVANAMAALRPATVIHLAAWTDVDGAESAPAAARRLNVDAARTVAAEAVRAGAGAVVHLSTDFVFDGTKGGPYVESDPPRPRGIYAETKAASEAAVRAAAPEVHLIVRTAWLYGAGGPNFVDTILEAARTRGALDVVTDQAGCPTWSEDLAAALAALVAADARGTFHACGRGVASRLELAEAAVRAAGLAVPIRPVTTAEMPRAAPRPSRVELDTSRLEREVGFRFPEWRASVRAYVSRRGGGEA